MNRLIHCLALLLLTAGAVSAQDVQPKDQAALDKWFEETMSGASLVGHFAFAGQSRPPQDESYRISKISKTEDGRWLFTAHMRYGERDFSIAAPFKVQWAGDTPVITLTNEEIAGMQGRFTARVLVYGDRYAGTWQHGPAGGHMWGKVEKAGAAKP